MRLVLPNSVFRNPSLSNFKQLIVYMLLIAAAKLDRVASETLAKVEEKCPIITKTPTEVTLSDCCTQFIGERGGGGGAGVGDITSGSPAVRHHFLEGTGSIIQDYRYSCGLVEDQVHVWGGGGGGWWSLCCLLGQEALP